MMMFKTKIAGYLHRKLIKAANIIILTYGPTLNIKINITGYLHPKIIKVANITHDAMTNFKHQKKKSGSPSSPQRIPNSGFLFSLKSSSLIMD